MKITYYAIVDFVIFFDILYGCFVSVADVEKMEKTQLQSLTLLLPRLVISSAS
jgi:hypothetical protein